MNLFKTMVLLFALAAGPLGAMQDSSQVVKVEGYPSLKPVHPDGLFTIAVQLHIQKGWHVNAHQGLPEYFIPLELSLPTSPEFSVSGNARYPSGEKKALGGSAQAFPVYQGDQDLYLDIKLAPSDKPG